MEQPAAVNPGWRKSSTAGEMSSMRVVIDHRSPNGSRTDANRSPGDWAYLPHATLTHESRSDSR
jgi:hypothetical protein